MLTSYHNKTANTGGASSPKITQHVDLVRSVSLESTDSSIPSRIGEVYHPSQDSSASTPPGTPNARHQAKRPRSTSRAPSPILSEDDKNVSGFFDAILSAMKALKPQILDVRPMFILVCHMTPTVFPYLKAIKAIGDVALLIPKGYQRENAKMVLEELKEHSLVSGCLIYASPNHNHQSDIRNLIADDGLNLIRTHVKDRKFIIIDIGGYFADTFEKIVLNSDEDFRSNFIGIVEDTENGHIKYMDVMERLRNAQMERLQKNEVQFLPSQLTAISSMYSVARSNLKASEDYNVGKSIVEAIEQIVRHDMHTTLNSLGNIGIIGFGKIGQSIATHLTAKGLSIMIFDFEPSKLVEATARNFRIARRENIIKESRLLICATGNKALNGADVEHFMDNVIIASCTSRDTEFDPGLWVRLQRCVSIEKGNIKKTSISLRDGSQKSIHFLDHGDAVNFVFGAVNGPHIYCVQAALVVSAIQLIIDFLGRQPANTTSSKFKPNNLSKGMTDIIAEHWLKTFGKYPQNINILSVGSILKKRISEADLISQFSFWEQNAYFLPDDLSAKDILKQIIDNTRSLMQAETKTLDMIDPILHYIRIVLDSGNIAYHFVSLFASIADILNKVIDDARLNHIHLKLLIVKAITDLYFANCGGFSNQDKAEAERLLDELQTNVIKLQDNHEVRKDREIVRLFRTLRKYIEIFAKDGTTFRIERIKIAAINELALAWIKNNPATTTSMATAAHSPLTPAPGLQM